MTPKAVKFASVALLLAFCVYSQALIERWQIAATVDGVYRIDRWTGEVRLCTAQYAMKQIAAAYGAGTPVRCTDAPTAELESGVPQAVSDFTTPQIPSR